MSRYPKESRHLSFLPTCFTKACHEAQTAPINGKSIADNFRSSLQRQRDCVHRESRNSTLICLHLNCPADSEINLSIKKLTQRQITTAGLWLTCTMIQLYAPHTRSWDKDVLFVCSGHEVEPCAGEWVILSWRTCIRFFSPCCSLNESEYTWQLSVEFCWTNVRCI